MKREEKALNTKNKIIEAAKLLIKENGIENISVDDITKEAKVAKGSFYVYFKKKEDIVSEIGCMEFRYINEEIDKLNDLNIVDKLKYYYKRYKEGVLLLGREISRCWLQNNLNCRCKLEYDYNTISGMLNKALKNNEIKDNTDIKVLSYKILSMIYGIMLIWIMSESSINLDDEDDSINLDDIINPYLVR